MSVGLSELKQHLRVDHDDEDELIQMLSDAAENQISDWLGRPVYARVEDLPALGTSEYHPQQMVTVPAIRVAVMMLVDRMYQERGGDGSTSDAAVPPASIRAMLAGYRVFAAMPVPI